MQTAPHEDTQAELSLGIYPEFGPRGVALPVTENDLTLIGGLRHRSGEERERSGISGVTCIPTAQSDP